MIYPTHNNPWVAVTHLDDFTLSALRPTCLTAYHVAYYLAALHEAAYRSLPPLPRPSLARHNLRSVIRFRPRRPDDIGDLDIGSYRSIWSAWRHVLRMTWDQHTIWSKRSAPSWHVRGQLYKLGSSTYRIARVPYNRPMIARTLFAYVEVDVRYGRLSW